MAPSWQRRFFAPARVPKFLRDDAQLTDRHLAMYLQHHEERRDAPLRGFRHEEAEAISASGLSSLSDSSDSTSPSRLQRHIFGARGQRPSLGGAGCFAAMVGGCGGCLVWSLGCHIVFLCVAAGAFAEQTVRHAQWRQRQRAYMSSSSEEDGDSSEDDSNANGLDQDTIELTTVVSTVNARSISQLLGRQSSDSEHCQCMICVEHFQKGDSIRTLPCLHRYHKKCIDEWLRGALSHSTHVMDQDGVVHAPSASMTSQKQTSTCLPLRRQHIMLLRRHSSLDIAGCILEALRRLRVCDVQCVVASTEEQLPHLWRCPDFLQAEPIHEARFRC